jgi:hypothetical protein
MQQTSPTDTDSSPGYSRQASPTTACVCGAMGLCATVLTAADAAFFSTAVDLANQLAVTDIECHGHLVAFDEPGRWYDTRPMLDEREHPPQVLELMSKALAFALASGAARRHSSLPHLVRVNTGSAL